MVIIYDRPETQHYRVNHTYTVNPVLCGHLKIYKTKILMNNDSLVKVESIAGAFYNTFDIH